MPVASPSSVRKKLIEVSIPLEAINAASAKEKSIRHGHPSTLHLWWARRPLAACRAVLFAQLVDDPSAWPDRFPTKEEQDAERKRLHDIIARMVPWEASSNEGILNEARWEIARSVAWGLGEEPPARERPDAILSYLQAKAPPVYDPFSGGGSIPLEAQRLGLRAYGSDLNPVAVLIGKALVEIPPKFAGRPPINPEARADKRLVGMAWKGAQGLAEDVRWYGRWMREEAEKRIGNLYPPATMPDGSKANVIAWLWARTVRSPDPAAKNAMVPLVSSYVLSDKPGRKSWLEVRRTPDARDGYEFVARSGELSEETAKSLKQGTKAGKGQAFRCILTGSPIERSYIQAEGKADRLGQRLLAVVGDGIRGRIYISPTDEQVSAAGAASSMPNLKEARSGFLSHKTPTRAMITGGVCSAYGLRSFGHLFTDRQLVALTTFVDLLENVRELVEKHFVAAGAASGALHPTSENAHAYSKAIKTYLAFAISSLVDRNASIVGWASNREHARNVFGRQALPMVWDFCENNVFSDSSGNFFGGVEKIASVLSQLLQPIIGSIEQRAAQNNLPAGQFVFSTDPPYFDNIGYAVLSDYFYLWLREGIQKEWPELFRRLTTPKEDELVASPYLHGGREKAEIYFMDGMSDTFKQIAGNVILDYPFTVYYAFKQSEDSDEGTTSPGWSSFLQAIYNAGLVIDGTWPFRTELARRFVGQGANALASSIVLVCRKRSDTAPVVTRAELLRELRQELPAAMREIIAARVGPVDFEQAVIGPGMGVFSRYAKVLEEDDSPMTVKTALALINRVRLEVDAQAGNFDPETQVALAWFHAHGDAEKPSGEAILLANAKGVSLDGLLASGVFSNGQGKVRLVRRERLPRNWSPSTNQTATIWECVQHTVRALDEGGAEAAAVLVKAMGQKAEDALSLSYRLYDIANARGDATEARVYAELAAEWPELEELAATLDEAVISRSAPAQPSLFA